MTGALLESRAEAPAWRRVYPFEGRFVSVPSGRMHVVDEGPRDAPVLVLVHGNPTWSFYWRHVIRALRSRFRVIAPDHMGCGLSDRPANFGFRLADHIDNLARVLDALDVDRYNLGVHDWGGAIGTGCALRAPERMERLAVFNTAAFRSRRIPTSINLCRLPLFGPVAIQGFNAFARVALLRCVMRRERLTPEVVSGYLDPYDGWRAREALLRFVQDIPMSPRHPSWSTLTAIDEGLSVLADKPTLIMWGGQDFCFDRSFYETWLRRFPGAEAHWLADCGHYVLEDAHERVVPTLDRFLGEDRLSLDFNIADRLGEVAELRGSHWALADGDHPEADRLSFEELDEDATHIARGLVWEGFEPGDRVLVFMKPSLDFFSLVWALFRMGAVPIFIDPAMGMKPVLRAIREADPKRVVATEAVLWLAKLYPRVFDGVQSWVRPQSVGLLGRSLSELRRMGAKRIGSVRHEAGRDGLAAVLFTSGSTGFPKGVLYSHGIFDGQRSALGASLGIEPGEVDFSAFPLFSCFSLLLGASVVIPNMDTTKPGAVDPTPVLETIERFGVTYVFGSPAFWRRIVGSRRRNALQGLTRVLMAGAPAPPDLLKELLRSIAPRADVFTPYGATESLPVSMPSARTYVQSFLTRTLEGQGTWVGRPLEGVELRIIPITDEALDELQETLPPDQVGEIVVRSEVTTAGYFMRPVADATAKIHDGEGRPWHRMGDLGYLDKDGHLWFCGRKSHRIETRAETVFPVQVEALVNQHPRVARSALVGVGARGKERPVLVVECRSGERPRGSQDRRRLEGELESASGRPDIAAVLFRATLPVDARHNAKIRREILKEWAEGYVA